MNCSNCNKRPNFEYYILKYGIHPSAIIGYGHFCSFSCATEKLKTESHGDSDYFESLSLMMQKYRNSDGVNTFYTPLVVKDFKPLLEHIEERQAVIPKYKVKRASENKRSTNDVLKNNFFGGKCEPIMTAKNLCISK